MELVKKYKSRGVESDVSLFKLSSGGTDDPGSTSDWETTFAGAFTSYGTVFMVPWSIDGFGVIMMAGRCWVMGAAS